MSRLNYMQDHELAVQTILDEVRVLERYVALGGQLDEQVVRDLLHSLERLSDIVKAAEQAEATRWETDIGSIYRG